ncbi:hypothetical protein BCR36DRAFT_356751 [Piromyces finnis]|uniref:Uncharacterized protein n=1 Tax=Piromyces finnis TaxID=1754191 RepID=A0A1Y1V3W0_9FUNG|nr:hypothetical protein BCR36DRAFT_356751 [Piromyces finnis]|eukprot:ORX46662.1 hypothetical protein BCR36DRAFT_356751 [Piromyces finnis]
MVVSKNSHSQRIVENLFNDQQLNNKNGKEKLEKSSKPKNVKKNKKEKLNEVKKGLSLQTQYDSNQYDEFLSATPDYLSAQTYEQQQKHQQQQQQSLFYNNGMSPNGSQIQTDYYSIYNQLANNTLLENVLNYNGYSSPQQQMNSYYSPVSNVSPVYSAYSDFGRSPYVMYSPNVYSYPLSAPIDYNGYTMPYDLGLDQPIKNAKKSKKKSVKKQAIRDYKNHEQQVIDQFHKNMNENKPNKIAGKKKINKDQKEIKKNRKIAPKNLKINTNSSKKVKPIFDRAQIISKNTTKPKKEEQQQQPIFNTSNVFPTYEKPQKKKSATKNTITKKANTKEPELQSMKPGLSKNTSTGYSFDNLPKRNSIIENVLNNELILSLLNNVYNGFTWTSKLTNSKTNRNISFLTKTNTDDSYELVSWKDSQTPGQKYSIASLLSTTNNPCPSGSIASERRINRKELFDYWSNMARNSMAEANRDSEKQVNQVDSFIHRMVQNRTISKNNDKLKHLNKLINKKSQSVVSEKETIDLFSGSTHHPIAKLNYLNVNISFNSDNANHHPLAVRFNKYYNSQQNMTVPSHNHGKPVNGRNVQDDKLQSNYSTEKTLNNDNPNQLYEYLLNMKIESNKKTTETKEFASADMLRPTSQPNSTNYESIATFTSPTVFSIPATVNNEVNPHYNFSSSNNYKFPFYYSPTMNIVDFTPYSTGNNNTFRNQEEFFDPSMNNNSLLTVLPQSFSNNSLLSLESVASSIHEMDFSNVRTHYDFMSVPKALPKKSKNKKSKKDQKPKETGYRGKSNLYQVQDINTIGNDNTFEPDYSLVDIMFNNSKEGSNTSLVGFIFNDEN